MSGAAVARPTVCDAYHSDVQLFGGHSTVLLCFLPYCSVACEPIHGVIGPFAIPCRGSLFVNNKHLLYSDVMVYHIILLGEPFNGYIIYFNQIWYCLIIQCARVIHATHLHDSFIQVANREF